MRVLSLTEEIRAAEILNSIYAFKRQQDETPSTFSPCIQSRDNIIYEKALWVKYFIQLKNSTRDSAIGAVDDM